MIEATSNGPKKMSAEPDLITLAQEVAGSYPDLRVPSGGGVHQFQAELSTEHKRRETAVHIFVATFVIFFLSTFPPLAAWSYHLAESFRTSLLPYLDRSSYFREYPFVLVGLGLGWVAAFSLVFEIRSRGIDTSAWAFRIFQATAAYILVGIVILLLHSLLPAARSYSQLAALGWLLPIVLLAAMAPMLLLFFLSASVFRRYLRERPTYGAIVNEVLHLLYVLKDVASPGQLSMPQRVKACDRIERTAAMFRYLYGTKYSTDPVMLWTRARMTNVADNLLALSAWIAFPNPESVVALKQRLVLYANVLLAGTTDALPANAVDDSFPFVRYAQRRAYLRRVANLMWLLALVILPLLAYAAIAMASGITLPSALQTPAAIAYSSWIAVCLLAHVENLAPEAKSVFFDVLGLLKR